jgi:DNA-directed RNA polymerase specialized sigma subunit
MGELPNFSHDTIHAYLEERGNTALRDELVEEAIPVVEHVAMLIVIRKKTWLPQHVDRDELFSEGLVKLTPIVEEFNPPFRKNLPSYFCVHVQRRVHWRLLDYIREERFNSRGAIRHALQFIATEKALRKAMGCSPTIGEIAEKLRISPEAAREWHVSSIEITVRNNSLDRKLHTSDKAETGNKDISLYGAIASVPQKTPEEQDAGFFALLPASLSDIERAIVISV